MKFWIPVAISIVGFGATILGGIMPFYIEAIRPFANYILAISITLMVGPLLLILFFYLKNKNTKTVEVTEPSTAIKSLLSDTHSLYNNTGLFIKSCYTDSVKTGGEKRINLDKEFKSYLKTFKGRMLELPQKLEPKISRFIYILEDYVKQGEIIISLPKTPECYSRQQKLEQDFSNNAPVLYSEIEVELRKILNKKTNPT